MTSLKSSATARHMSIISEDTAAIHPPSNDSFPSTPQPTDWWADRHSIFLLIALYAAQGLPIGLAFGSIPFLLKERGSSYADLAQFSFATLPYSLKLFIAPIVDTFYHPSFGRRKSWIVPVQLAIGAVTLIFSDKIQNWVNAGDVSSLLPVFFFIISLTATQDIAVDGWSLTMLKKANVSYASTCQSLGITIGYFATFTIFLALSNASFCDTYARPLLFLSSTSGPLADLRLVLRSAGLYYFCLTFYITFFKHEQPDVSFSKKNDDDTELLSLQLSGSHMVEDAEETLSVEQSSRSKTFDSIASTYSDLLVVIRLPAVQNLVFALLIAKLGFSAYDNVAPLKLLEVGFSKESMASMAVLQAPFSLIGTILTGRWVAKKSPIYVYLTGYLFRLIISLTGPPCIALLTSNGGVVSTSYYLLVLTLTISYSLATECLMFIGMGAFFLNITSSSVHVAGSYLTLLNTSSNMGGIWHKALVLWLVDKLTIRENCVLAENSADKLCPVVYDGYFILSFLLLPIAAAVGFYLVRIMPRLASLPGSAWKASR